MPITDSQFQLIKRQVYNLTGNVISDNRSAMAHNRISKLLKTIGDDCDIAEMLRLVSLGFYTEEFISAFTTNKTDFFREGFHFEDLINRVFPSHFEKENKIAIYSSASSTGEEPYSAAISFLNFKEQIENPSIKAKITATDIDSQVLAKAMSGVYERHKNSPPFPQWVAPQKYFQKRDTGNGEEHFLIKTKETLKDLVEFRKLNLFRDIYPFDDGSFDVIFCRNVLIYFSQEDQNKILKKLFLKLKIGGTLYLGHSESPLGLSRFVDRLGQNIFIKQRECD